MKRRTITMRRIIRDAAEKHRRRRAPKRVPEFHLLNFYQPDTARLYPASPYKWDIPITWFVPIQTPLQYPPHRAICP